MPRAQGALPSLSLRLSFAKDRAEGTAQLTDYLPRICETLSWITSIIQSRCVAHAYDLSTEEVQAGGLEIQGHSQLRGKFKTSLGHLRLKKEKHIKTIIISNTFPRRALHAL